MMRKTLSRSLTCCIWLCAAVATSYAVAGGPADDRVAWLRQHATLLRTIDPLDEDFSDLEPLVRAIGNARIVLLGEATHGDGAAFQAKGRLVKFLHQRLGFDVLAFEAGFYECAKAGEAIESGKGRRAAVDKAVPILLRTDQCRPLMEYIQATKQTARPIALAGMSWYTYADSALFDDVIAFFEAVDPSRPTRKQRDVLAGFRKTLLDLGNHRRPKAPVRPPGIEHVESMIDTLSRDPGGAFRGRHGTRAVGLMRIALENLKGFMAFWHRPLTRGGVDDDPLGVIEMRNVLFLANEYFPGRKLIVWAHNGHIARGTAQVEELEKKFKFNETIATGQRIHDAMGAAVYAIAIMAHGGKSNGWWGEPRELSAPPEGSLEDLMHRAGLKQAFVDLRGLPPGHWLRKRQVARPVSYAPMRADWSQVYDGLLFIDTMTPSTTISVGP